MTHRGDRVATTLPLVGRCRCGHLATNHMVTVAIPGSASFRLDPTGPCQVCGEAGCRQFAPAPR